MSWYNEVKNMEENVTSYFLNKAVDLVLLEKLLKEHKQALKAKSRSFELVIKIDHTERQSFRHELNCRDLEFKTKLVQFCINELNNDY